MPVPESVPDLKLHVVVPDDEPAVIPHLLVGRIGALEEGNLVIKPLLVALAVSGKRVGLGEEFVDFLSTCLI